MFLESYFVTLKHVLFCFGRSAQIVPRTFHAITFWGGQSHLPAAVEEEEPNCSQFQVCLCDYFKCAFVGCPPWCCSLVLHQELFTFVCVYVCVSVPVEEGCVCVFDPWLCVSVFVYLMLGCGSRIGSLGCGAGLCRLWGRSRMNFNAHPANHQTWYSQQVKIRPTLMPHNSKVQMRIYRIHTLIVLGSDLWYYFVTGTTCLLTISWYAQKRQILFEQCW